MKMLGKKKGGENIEGEKDLILVLNNEGKKKGFMVVNFKDGNLECT